MIFAPNFDGFSLSNIVAFGPLEGVESTSTRAVSAVPSEIFRAKLEIVQARMAAEEERRLFEEKVSKFKREQEQRRRDEERRLQEQEQERIRKRFEEKVSQFKREQEERRRNEERRLKMERLERIKKEFEETVRKRANERQRWHPRKRSRPNGESDAWPRHAEQPPWRQDQADEPKQLICFNHDPQSGSVCHYPFCRKTHLNTYIHAHRQRFDRAKSFLSPNCSCQK